MVFSKLETYNIFKISISRIYFLLFVFVFFFHFSAKESISQEIDQSDEDPYLDPYAAEKILNPPKRFDSSRSFLLGMSYGLNPIILLAPAINFAFYWDPLIFGLQMSDSDSIGIWNKERRENFGSSRFRASTEFFKWFVGENIYFIITNEKRRVDLWNRTYNRDSAKALFDMFVNTKLNSFGIGFLRFNRIGYLGIDIIRLNFFKKDLVTVEEKWETWTDLKGSRDRLDENIQERSDKWKKILNSPTGFLITVGLNF